MKTLVAFLALVVIVVLALGIYVWRHPVAIFNAMNRRALKNAGFSRVSVQSQIGAQIVWEAGAGPVVVLLHGAGDHAGTWAKVAPELKSHFRVLVLDMAGHGESEPRTGTLQIGALVNGVEDVIGREAGTQPVTIVGNSLGAWIAMLYAQRHPERVSRVVLVNGGAIVGQRPDLAFVPQNRGQARKMFDSMMDSGSPKPPDFVLDDVAREANRGAMARLLAGVQQWPAYLMDDKLAQFNTPVDLVWGTADQLFPVEYARRMQAQLPSVRLTEIPRCGHVPQQECPKTFLAMLNQVLAQPAPSSGIKAQAAVEKN